MHRISIGTGIILAAFSVMLGAFGAHALKSKLGADQLQVFETAVRYQMYHAIALLLLGFNFEKLNTPFALYAAWLFFAGIIFFSGSLYLLSCKNLLGVESWKFLGPITPLGGLSFIAGWFMFLIAYFKSKPL